MRPGPGKVAVVLLLAFTVAGCGSSDSKPPKLFSEYLESEKVENDTFRAEGEHSEQVLEAFTKAEESKDVSSRAVMQAVVLWAYSCDEYYNGPLYPDCNPGGEADKAIAAAAGSDGTTHARYLLVKRESGSLELVPVFVVRDGKDKAVLIDTTGQTYSGGLADFRANNSLFGADDWMLAPADITEVPKDDEIPLEIDTVTVPGHTPGTWGWWAAGAGLVVLLFLGYAWFNWTPRTKHRAPDNSDAGMLGSL